MVFLLALECCGQERMSRSFSDSALGFFQAVAGRLATAVVTGKFFVVSIVAMSE